MDETNFEQWRSLLGPDCRWQLAEMLQGNAAPRADLPADALVEQAAAYIEVLLSDDEPPQAGGPHATLAAAKALWDQDQMRERFVTLTLGDCPPAVIAARLGVDEEIVRCVEALFFDVRSLLSATDWIHSHVIRATAGAGAAGQAIKYRAALWGGPAVAQALLDAENRFAMDEVQRIADQEQRLAMKVLEALEMPLDDSRDALRLIQLNIERDQKAAVLELRKQQFRQRCEQALRQHALDERRLEAKLEREQARQQARRDRDIHRAGQQQAQRQFRSRLEQLRRRRERQRQQAAQEKAQTSPLAALLWSKPKPLEQTVSSSQHQEQTQVVTWREETEAKEVLLETVACGYPSDDFASDMHVTN